MNTITLFILFIPILVVILLIANLLLAVHRPDSEKVTPYECGFSPVYGQTRNPFSISFYLVGILFLVFDLEILLVYPMASTMYTIGAYGFWIFIIFFIILTIGFVYEFGSGALYFTDKRSNINVSKNDKTVKNSPFTIQRRMYHTTKININNKDINNYINQVFEKDNGQVTDNVHLIARRHIASTNISDHTIICNNAVNNLSTKVICELLYYKVPVGQATLLENFSLIIRHLNINRVKIFSFIVVNYNRCYATYAPLHGGFMNVFVNALNANPGMSSESFLLEWLMLLIQIHVNLIIFLNWDLILPKLPYCLTLRVHQLIAHQYLFHQRIAHQYQLYLL